MKPHIAMETFNVITERLTHLDAEVRSIRAMLFQLAEAQHRQFGDGDAEEFRGPEDHLTRPD